MEHYNYDNVLLRIVKGASAKAICRTVIDEGWVSELSHAAYLGRELARAEFCLSHGVEYIQDGA